MQLSIRLLVPDGSLLLGDPELRVDGYDDAALGWTWRHDDPKFAQSLTITAEEDGNRLVSKGRMSKDGGEWVDDLSQVFTRSL